MICLHEFESPLEQIWLRPADVILIHSGSPAGAPQGASVLTAYGKMFHVFESAEDVARLVYPASMPATLPPDGLLQVRT